MENMNMEDNYSVKIKDSSREFTKRERLAFKDLTNAEKFDTVVGVDEKLTITPTDWAILEITNPKSEKDVYYVYVVRDNEANKYYTSSAAFWSSFMNIYDELEGEEFSINVYKCESKNYKGKYFITCSVVW